MVTSDIIRAKIDVLTMQLWKLEVILNLLNICQRMTSWITEMETSRKGAIMRLISSSIAKNAGHHDVLSLCSRISIRSNRNISQIAEETALF